MSKYGIQHSNDILVFQGRAGGKVVGQGQVNDSEVALCALSTKVSKHEHENDQYATQVTNFVTCLSLFPKPRAIRRPYVLFYVLFPDGPKVFKRRSYCPFVWDEQRVFSAHSFTIFHVNLLAST